MNWESIVTHLLTILASGATAWLAMEKRIATNTEAIASLRRDLNEVETEQDQWRASSQLLAVAINDLGHYAERLKAIEAKLDDLRYKARHN